IQLLKSRDPKRVYSSRQDQSENPIVFMFPGQAAQYVNMGLEIYRTEKRFQEEIDLCCKLLRPHLDFDLRHVLYPSQEKLAEASARLNETSVTQPAMFVVEYALAKLWLDWGLTPAAMIGHSIGEYVAACLAGVFSLEDALALIAARGRLMQSLPRGSMLAVRLKEEDVKRYLGQELSLAVVNGNSACVVAGPDSAIATLEESLTGQGIGCRVLETSHAFHSHMMEPIVGPFLELFKNIQLRSPRIPYLSNVTGTWIHQTQAQDPNYWASHMVQTVRFADGIGELMKQPQRVFLEIGPGNGLTSLAKKHPARAPEITVLPSFGYAEERISDLAEIRTTLGRLWLAGARVNWPTFHDGQERHRIPLPTYPFERRRHWIDRKTPSTKPIHEGESSDQNEETEPILAQNQDGGKNIDDSATASKRPELRTTYVAPRTELHEELASVWQATLGVDQIGIDDNFFELGGDSLTAAQVISQLRVFGKRLPLASLIQAPTIRQFSELVASNHDKPSWSSLVKLAEGGPGRPLFLMHSHGGNILEYQPLANRLGKDRPIYALQARGLDGNIPENP
ncbi:MAG: acyltransferase domain-containing protein, partial [Candidatus Acidiferrales bacterium]